MTNPAAPALVGSYNTAGTAYDVAIGENYVLYVADGAAGLVVLDVADPRRPTLAARYDTPGDARGLIFADGRVYLADGGAGLLVFDVANPAAPALAASFDTPGFAYDVVVSSHYVYVADNSYDLRVIDLQAPLSATACDAAGNCTTVTAAAATVTRPDSASILSGARPQDGRAKSKDAALGDDHSAPFDSAPPLRVLRSDVALPHSNLSVSFAGLPSPLGNLDPVSVAGQAQSSASTLQALTVTVASAADPLLVETWPAGELSEMTWETAWTPAGEGEHILQAEARDWAGNVATDIFTVTVDALPPAVALTPTVVTGTAYYEPSTISLTALMTDTIGLAGCRWRVAGGEWQAGWLGDKSANPPLAATCRAAWNTAGALPDSAAFEVTMEATDLGDHTTQVTEMVTVDVMPPAAGALTLRSGDLPVASGDTVADGALTLEWTAATDGSGLGDYTVQWRSAVTDVVTTASETVSPAGSLTASFIADEGQQISVGLMSQDIYGQETWANTGPITVDGPFTPDYIWLGARTAQAVTTNASNWLASGCTLLGADRRAARHAAGQTTRSAEQQLYATWGHEALGLAWAGAAWDLAGDLFIYLDVDPTSGEAIAFNPYLAPSGEEDYSPDGTTVTLPTSFGADVVAWVRDTHTAQLFRWDGSEWVHLADLGPAEYRHDPAAQQTRLYLPFDLLGVADPTANALGLLAFASEEDMLRLWAALPAANPLNSDRATGLGALAEEDRDITLTHAYRWDALGPGICPNGSLGGAVAYPDSDLRVSLASDPAAASYSLLADGLFWLSDLLTSTPPPDVNEQLSFLARDQLPLGPGTPVSYTLAFRNLGAGTAAGAFAEVTAQYDLRLTGAADGIHLTVPLGDVAPLAEGTVSFDGYVVPGGSAIWAPVTVRIFDAAHPATGEPLEWLWMNHRVDRTAPEFMGIAAPKYWLGPGLNQVAAYVYDDAGVAQAQLDVNGTDQVACVPVEQNGSWTCAWDVAGSDGDIFQVRMTATDRYGQAGGWAPTLPYRLDAAPPTLTLDEVATQVVAGSLVQGSSFALYGSADDASGIASVNACVADDGQAAVCGQATWSGTPVATAAAYEDIPVAPAAIGAATSCANPFVVTYPVTGTFAVADAAVGLAVQHTQRDDLQVELTSPAGTTVRLFADDGLPSTHFAHLNVMLADAAVAGLFTAQGDDETPVSTDGGAAYVRSARPYAPLRAFQGQSSQGNWTLRICDTDTGTNDGAYYRSRLSLTPRDIGVKAAGWSYVTPEGGKLDHVARTVTLTANDIVGNHSVEPLSLQFTVDNVAPVITVTHTITEVWVGGTATVLAGLVTDGGPSVNVTLLVQDPTGATREVPAARDGDRWWYDLTGVRTGRYLVSAQAFDLAGNGVGTETLAVDVICASAAPEVTAILAVPAAGDPFSVTISVTVRNAGAETLPAGLAVGIYVDGARLGTTTLATALAPGAEGTTALLWPDPALGDHAVAALVNDPEVGQAGLPLCTAPVPANQQVGLLDISLDELWNLVSTYVDPLNRDITVVQRPIAGQYLAITSFDNGALTFYPWLDPKLNTLKTVDGWHGYGIRLLHTPPLPTGDAEEPDYPRLRVVGRTLPVDTPLPLDPRWNLVSYLPRRTLPVTEALTSIAGQYTAVLGYNNGALSLYPDLTDSYNTLTEMAPLYGYWIKTTAAVTLTYPITPSTASSPEITAIPGPGEDTPSEEATGPLTVAERVAQQRDAEQDAGVQPTLAWMNFYGPAILADGTPLAPGSLVLALDPQGVTCGAAVVTTVGQYGLLPCYGDDAQTTEDEGGAPGDVINIVVEGEVVARGTWLDHGERELLPFGQMDSPLPPVTVTPEPSPTPPSRVIWLPLVLRTADVQAPMHIPTAPSPALLPTETPAPPPASAFQPAGREIWLPLLMNGRGD